MFIVGRTTLKVGDGHRGPGDAVPEAAEWVNLRAYLQCGHVLEVSDDSLEADEARARLAAVATPPQVDLAAWIRGVGPQPSAAPVGTDSNANAVAASVATLNAAAAVATVDTLATIAELDAARAAEVAHGRYPGGRTSVLKAIDARLAAVATPPQPKE